MEVLLINLCGHLRGALLPQHFPEEGDGAGEDFFLAAGDEVVFAVDFHQCCAVAVGFRVLLAAPHGDDGVFGSMQEQDTALIGGDGDLFCVDSSTPCRCAAAPRGGLMKSVPSQTPRVDVNDADACINARKKSRDCRRQSLLCQYDVWGLSPSQIILRRVG